MRAVGATLALVALGLGGAVGPAGAQTAAAAECARLRRELASHAELSDGVRRALAAQVARYPAQPPVTAAPSAAPAGTRADAVRARLAQIPAERQRLEEQRLGAIVRFDLARANQAQSQIEALDQEKATLQRELASLPAGSAVPAPAPPTPAPAAGSGNDADHIRCQDVRATLDTAVRTRQRELGAREGQPGVVPLTALRGRTGDEIASTLAAQFAAWPAAASQLGLLDADGDGRLDGFGDVPADGVYRLYRQRGDGSVAVELFAAPGRAAPGEMARRLEEETARRTGRTLAELVVGWPAGAVRTLGETAAFGTARARFMAGDYADAGRLPDAAARAVEYSNLRGENVRLLEVFTPAPGGVAYRRVLIVPRPGDQELWEESAMVVRPASYWRTDVEVGLRRQLRSATGAAVGAPTATGPVKFSLER